MNKVVDLCRVLAHDCDSYIAGGRAQTRFPRSSPSLHTSEYPINPREMN